MSDSGTDTVTFRAGVAEEVRALLGRRRMSDIALARAIERSHTYVYRRLSGETAFDTDDLAAIAKALDVKPGDLLPPIARYPSLAHLEHPPAVRILPIPVQRDPSQAGPTALAMKRATDNLAASRVF